MLCLHVGLQFAEIPRLGVGALLAVMCVQSFLLDPLSVWSALPTPSYHARGRMPELSALRHVGCMYAYAWCFWIFLINFFCFFKVDLIFFDVFCFYIFLANYKPLFLNILNAHRPNIPKAETNINQKVIKNRGAARKCWKTSKTNTYIRKRETLQTINS